MEQQQSGAEGFTVCVLKDPTKYEAFFFQHQVALCVKTRDICVYDKMEQNGR